MCGCATRHKLFTLSASILPALSRFLYVHIIHLTVIAQNICNSISIENHAYAYDRKHHTFSTLGVCCLCIIRSDLYKSSEYFINRKTYKMVFQFIYILQKHWFKCKLAWNMCCYWENTFQTKSDRPCWFCQRLFVWLKKKANASK